MYISTIIVLITMKRREEEYKSVNIKQLKVYNINESKILTLL